MKTSPIQEESPNSTSPFSFTKAFQFKRPEEAASPRISAFNNWSPCGTQPNYDRWTSPFIDFKCLSGLSPLLTTPFQIKTTQKTAPSSEITIEKGTISQFDSKITPNEEETEDSITISKKPKEPEPQQQEIIIEQVLSQTPANERQEEQTSVIQKKEPLSDLREIEFLKKKETLTLKKKEVKKVKPNPERIEEQKAIDPSVPTGESLKFKEITTFEGLISDLNYDFESDIEDVDFETGYLLCRAEEEQTYGSLTAEEGLHFSAIFPTLKHFVGTSGVELKEDLSSKKKKKAFAYQCSICGKKYAKSSSLGGHVAKAHQGFSSQATLKKEQRDKRALERDRNKFLRDQCLQQLNTQ